MDMTAVIQYLLTSAQSFGSQDYYKKSLMTILGLAGVLFCDYCLTKISIRAKRSISHVFFLLIVPSPCFVHYSAKTSRHGKNELSFVPKKYLFACP